MNDFDMQKMISSLSKMNKNELEETLQKTINENNISKDTVNNLLNTFGNNKPNTVPSDSQPIAQDVFNNIDMETMLRMQSIIGQMNSQNNPHSDLLASLKPYIKESSRGKLDQYIRSYENE